MCYDPESRAIKEPTTMGRGEGGVKYTSCWEDWNENPGSGQVYWEEVQDTVLPAGMSVTQTDVLSGTTTTYFMKPKRMRQIIPLTADQSACDSISSIPENAVATFNNVDLTDAMHFDMPARPTDAVLKVTVEGIICKYDPACAGSSAPAPAGN